MGCTRREESEKREEKGIIVNLSRIVGFFGANKFNWLKYDQSFTAKSFYQTTCTCHSNVSYINYFYYGASTLLLLLLLHNAGTRRDERQFALLHDERLSNSPSQAIKLQWQGAE